MVVEDDVLMCDELLDMLTKAGYRAVKPDGFDNIIEQILDMAPDILLLDINLPGRSGFDICREIKRRSSVPVLVLTSRGQLKDELHALELGADEFLTKPCRRERLLAQGGKCAQEVRGQTEPDRRRRVSSGHSDIHSVYRWEICGASTESGTYI